MRILHVVHQFLPEYVGGTEVYVADLASRLRQRGHDVALFTGSGKAGERCWDGIPLRAVPGGLRRGPGANFLATFGSREAEAAFQDQLGGLKPDIIHFHHLLGLSTRLVALARNAGIPTCFTLHDYWFMCPKSQLIDHRGLPCLGPRAGVNCARCGGQRLNRPAAEPFAPLAAPLFILRERRVKRAVASADLVLAPSSFVVEMALAGGIPGEKLRRVCFGVDAASGVAWRPRPAGAPLRVTYLGGIDWSKGVHLLLAAAQRAGPVAAVRVYGDLAAQPDYAASLRAAVLWSPAQLMGQVSRTEVPAVLADTDLLAVPSLWYENSPMVIAEAKAAGIPVVASDIGALPEQVRHGETGLLFPPGDVEALAEAMRRVAGDPVLLERLREGVRAQAHATRTQHVDEMEAIYGEVAGLR